jgi:hypothetical protein
MTARIWIIGTAMLSSIPSLLLALFSYGGDLLNRLLFALVFPFAGTYPLPLDYINHTDRMADYWPFLVACGVGGLGICGLVAKSNKLATIFVSILVLSWGLTLIRLFILERA